MKYCPSCGSELDAGDSYCQECGEELTEAVEEETHAEEKVEGGDEDGDGSGMSSSVKAGIALVALVVVVGIALSAGGGGSNVETDTTPDSPGTQEPQDPGTTNEPPDDSESSAGSDSSDTEAAGSEDTDQSSAAEDIPTHEVGEAFTVGSGDRAIRYTVEEATTTDYIGPSSFGAEADGIFLVVTLRMENVGNQPISITTNHLELVDVDGRTFTVDTMAGAYVGQDSRFDGDSISFEELQPGLNIKRNLVYDVPPGNGYGLTVSGASMFSSSETHLVPIGQAGG